MRAPSYRRRYPRGDVGRWGRPLPAPIERQESWADFCRSVKLRIDWMRKTEGINSTQGDVWQAFEPPLPSDLKRQPPRRVGRQAPIPITPRDARGRWERGGLAS